MPTSIDPGPKDDEVECANCDAYFYYELTHCPNCGVSVYGPVDEVEQVQDPGSKWDGFFIKLRDAFHRTFNKPYAADEIFGDVLDQSVLYNDLLHKVGGDPAIVERLVEYERARTPESTRKKCLQNAIQRWDQDNHN